MKFAYLALALAAFAIPSVASAQVPFQSIPDRFKTEFPTKPVMTDTTFAMEDLETGDPVKIKGHAYTSKDAEGGTYSVSIFDFAPYYAPHEITVQGAMEYAAVKYRNMGKVTFDTYQRTDRIPSTELYITLPNGRRLYVTIVLHQETVYGGAPKKDDPAQRRLYIAEANVPADARPPELFLTTLQIIDEQGRVIRYEPNGVKRLDPNRGAGGAPANQGKD